MSPDGKGIDCVSVIALYRRKRIVAALRPAIIRVLNGTVGVDPVVVGHVGQIPRPGPAGAERQILANVFHRRSLQRIIRFAAAVFPPGDVVEFRIEVSAETIGTGRRLIQVAAIEQGDRVSADVGDG